MLSTNVLVLLKLCVYSWNWLILFSLSLFLALYFSLQLSRQSDKFTKGSNSSLALTLPCSDFARPTVCSLASAVFPCSLYLSRCKDLSCFTSYGSLVVLVDHFIHLLCFFLFLATFFFFSFS